MLLFEIIARPLHLALKLNTSSRIFFTEKYMYTYSALIVVAVSDTNSKNNRKKLDVVAQKRVLRVLLDV